MQDDMASLFAFNRWATERSLDACRRISVDDYVRALPGGVVSLRGTVTHLAGATMAWVRRIEGEHVISLPTEVEIPTLDEAIAMAEAGLLAFDQLVPTLTQERLQSILIYRSLANLEKRLPLWVVLRHVVNHASYHRGQISCKLKTFDVVAPSTDLIAWAYEATQQA